MINKGVVIYSLCTNPTCPNSERKIQTKATLVYAVSSGSCTFKIPKHCPTCKSEIEVLNFVSGAVEIKADVIAS